MKIGPFTLLPLLLLFCSCATQQKSISQANAGVIADSATSVHLSANKPANYYVEQGVKYFRSMESLVPKDVRPFYSPLVIRWEWPPWLLLTGYRRLNLINSDIILKLYPTKYDTIDCHYFEKEPFCRCHVIFNYSGTRIPIYEEFTFNDQGEITFIEAWSDYPSLIPMNPKDYWAQADSVKRLSTRIPGLGNATGRINIKANWMTSAAAKDPELFDLIRRIKHPFITYTQEYSKQHKQMAAAYHPPKGDRFPYYP